MIKAILKGWRNYIFTDQDMEDKAKERAKICAKCPQLKKGTFQKLMPDKTLQNIKGFMCNVCKCPLSTLLRQNEKQCKLKKWT